MDLFTEKYLSCFDGVGILPVVCLESQGELDTFLEAILKTSIKCIEITMRHTFSTEAIRFIKENHPEVVVGAGTVSNVEKLEESIDCGADFCVAPGTLDEVLKRAEEKKIPFLAGCSTPSEIMKLVSMGYQTVKYFPAECSGGTKALKLYEGAFAGIRFLPTGGITAENLPEYLTCKNVVACGGSFMVPKLMLEKKNADKIAETINNLIKYAR